MGSTAKQPPTTTRPQTPPYDWDSLTPEVIAVLCADAEGWRPDAGDEITGRVLSVKVGTSEIVDRSTNPPTVKQTAYPIVVVLREGARIGERAVTVHCFHAVTMNEILSARPQNGERIFIKYLRQAEGKDGRQGAHLYAIAFPDNVSNKNVWDQFRKEG